MRGHPLKLAGVECDISPEYLSSVCFGHSPGTGLSLSCSPLFLPLTARHAYIVSEHSMHSINISKMKEWISAFFIIQTRKLRSKENMLFVQYHLASWKRNPNLCVLSANFIIWNYMKTQVFKPFLVSLLDKLPSKVLEFLSPHFASLSLMAARLFSTLACNKTSRNVFSM